MGKGACNLFSPRTLKNIRIRVVVVGSDMILNPRGIPRIIERDGTPRDKECSDDARIESRFEGDGSNIGELPCLRTEMFNSFVDRTDAFLDVYGQTDEA